MTDVSKSIAAIPTEVTIGETTHVVKDTPELKAFVSKILTNAQQTERGKLYSKIESLENSLQSATRERDDSMQELEGLKGKISVQKTDPTKESMKQALDKENEKVSLTAEQIAAIVDKRFSESLPEILQQHLEPLTKKLASTESAQLELYREKRLQELGDAVVPELVTGTNREEIEKSIEDSKAIRQRYIAPTPQTPPANEKPIAPPAVKEEYEQDTPKNIPAPPSKSIGLPEQRSEDIKGMSLSDFEKKREDLLKKLTTDNVYQPLNS